MWNILVRERVCVDWTLLAAGADDRWSLDVDTFPSSPEVKGESCVLLKRGGDFSLKDEKDVLKAV